MSESVDQHVWRAMGSRRVAENPWFSVHAEDVLLPNGRQDVYHTVRFANEAVGVVARQADQYLLIHQYRYVIGRFVWGIAAGGISEGETAAAAASRELLEETGYRAASLRELVSFYPSVGTIDQKFTVFLADGVMKEHDSFDTDEVIEIRWFSRQELLTLIAANGMVDGMALGPLMMALFETELCLDPENAP